MLTVIVVLKAVIAVAGLALLGQGVLYILAGAGRETNVFFRMLRTIAWPATRLVRLITPRKMVPDHYIPVAAFFLMAGIYMALVIEQTNQCLGTNLQHFSCEPLAQRYAERCVAGQAEACEVLRRAGATDVPAAK